MRYRERDDAELVELAQAGWAPAFAVLVHRHGATVLAAHADAPDPVARTADVLVRAVHELPGIDPQEPVAPWLLRLARRPPPWSVPSADDADLDALWRIVAAHWPTRPRHRRGRRALRTAAVVVGAIALGVAVPTALLQVEPDDQEELTELRAQPVDDAPPDPEPADATSSSLPSFEFPEVDDAEPVPSTGLEEAAPPPDPDPEPPPEATPSPAPSSATEPDPDRASEPDQEAGTDPEATTEPVTDDDPAEAPGDDVGQVPPTDEGGPTDTEEAA